MRFKITDEETRKANIPHELFLTNLVGNHILMFVAAAGMYKSAPYLLASIPVISFVILSFTLWRAQRSVGRDPWYVMCHWQICARRSRIFLIMLALLGVAAGIGWYGHTQLGWMKEAVYALTMGIGVLPVMVTVLVLVIMESDALYHANLHRLPNWVVAKYPNPNAEQIPEPAAAH